MKTLNDVLRHELAIIHDAEQQFARALAALAKAAVAERLQRILSKYLKETTEHLTKLEAVFEQCEAKTADRTCATAAGLVEEAAIIAAAFKGSPALDAALIGVVQKLTHYQIAAYGCLLEWAELLGNEPATATLQSILEEEKTANEALTQLARARCNDLANVADTVV